MWRHGGRGNVSNGRRKVGDERDAAATKAGEARDCMMGELGDCIRPNRLGAMRVGGSSDTVCLSSSSGSDWPQYEYLGIPQRIVAT